MVQKKKLKILLILDNYYPYIGGAETLFQKIAEGLVSKGHIVQVITSQWADAALEEVVNGVSVSRVPSSRYLLPIKAYALAKENIKKIDVVLTSTYAMASLASYLAKKNKKPCVLVFHELLGSIWFASMPFSSALFHWVAEKVLLKFFQFSRIIGVSEFTCNQLNKVGIKKNQIYKIYNAFDPFVAPNVSPYQTNEGAFQLFFAGRPGYSKGAYELIQAIKILKEKGVKVQLTMALGVDPARNRLKIIKFINANELNDVISIKDSMSFSELSTHAFYADACVVPSQQEGFGILAAQFSQLANILIVSRKGALPETVGGKIVWVIEVTPDDIAKAIEKASRGEIKVLPVKSFCWSKVVDEYQKILLEAAI